MSAEDPYRWAKTLVAEGHARDTVISRMVAGGVEHGLAAEIVDSIERNRPRVEPVRIVFGGLLVMAGIGLVVSLHKPVLAGTLIVVGAFAVWDGLRGKR